MRLINAATEQLNINKHNKRMYIVLVTYLLNWIHEILIPKFKVRTMLYIMKVVAREFLRLIFVKRIDCWFSVFRHISLEVNLMRRIRIFMWTTGNLALRISIHM